MTAERVALISDCDGNIVAVEAALRAIKQHAPDSPSSPAIFSRRRDQIAVAAGAEASLTTLKLFESTCGDSRYWPDPVAPQPVPQTRRLTY